MRILILVPLLAAFAFLELFIGGARLLYTLPAVGCIALAALLSCLPSLKTSQRGNLPALIISLLFAGYIGVRNRFSEVEYIGRTQLFILSGCLLIYLLFTLVLTKPVDRRRFFLFLGVLALLQMIPALIQFTQKNQWMPLSWAQRLDAPSWRASGFFICPNHFSGFIEVMALLAASHTIWGRTTIFFRLLSGYAALLLLVGVAISGSRGGYLSLTVGFIVLLTLSFTASVLIKKKQLLLSIFIAIGTSALLFAGIYSLLFLNQNLSDRVAQINDPENCRLLLWSAAIQQFHLSPIWGTGGFSYLYYGRLFRDVTIQNDPIHVHNDYLQVLSDYGVAGFTLLLILLLTHLSAGVSAFRKLSASSLIRSQDLHSDRLALNIGCLSAVADYLVHSFVDFNMQLPLNAFMMAVVLASLANPGAPSEAISIGRIDDAFRSLLRYCIPLLALAAMIYGLPMIRGEYLAERARVALRDNHQLEALNWARRGTSSIHDNPELYYYQGEAALELLQIDKNTQKETDLLKRETVDSFTLGLKVFPYDSRLSVSLAQALATVGNYDQAIDQIDYAKRIDPNSGYVMAYSGGINSMFGHFADAKIDFEEAIKFGGAGALIARKGLNEIEKKKKIESAVPQPSP